MNFQQIAEAPLLYTAANNDEGNGAAPAGTLLYLLPPGSATPASITLADSWNVFSGAYLLLAQALPAGQAAAFASLAQQFLAASGIRFVWFAPPYDGQILSGAPIAMSTPTGDGTTVSDAPFVFRNLTLTLQRGAAVALDEANNAFNFTAGGQGLFLTAATPTGTKTIFTLGPQLTLPLTGALAGCLQFPLTLSQDNLSDLDVGLHYYYALSFDAQAVSDPAADVGNFFMGAMRYPVFNQGLTLYANLDPLAALDPARAFFAFNGPDAGQMNAPLAPPVLSYYSSTLGDPFSLAPQPGSAASSAFAALVLAVNPQTSVADDNDPVYLTPRGDFALQCQRSGAVELMCGLSGVEYMGLRAPANLVSFFPGHDAFAYGFQPGQKPGQDSATPASLPTTSYATVTVPQGQLDYFAQPDQSVLYNYNPAAKPDKKLANPITALAAVPVQAATLDWPPASAPVFPLLPYAGLAGQDLAAYQQLEAQIINPARRQALANAPPQARPQAALDAPASPYSTTPQGLLANYDAGEIVLAQMTLPQKGQTKPAQLRLENVANELLGAFQSNKMFLVVSDPTKLTNALQPLYDQIILGTDAAESWQFDLDPRQWQANGTMMLIKFYDMSIADLLGQTSAWASGAFFNNGSAAVAAATLKTIIEEAGKGDSDFAAFLNAVNNPNWNGILLLNVRAPLDELPSELAGLAVGIDQSQFRAHHVGINAAKINAPAVPGPITIEPSSIFALIHYEAPKPLQPNLGDYQFQVAQLRVLFLNSAVAGFSSVIDLQINTLFGEAATQAGAPDNIVKFYGVYQKHVVNGQTQESYAFQTQSGQAATFDLKSNVLNAVQLSKGQFVTVTSQDTAQHTTSQFVFWGLLDFKALAGFDLFSFGREAGATTPAGLNFSKLVIELEFDPTATPPAPQFTFDAAQLTFDLAASTARAQSFFSHFPLTVAGFTQARQGTAPDGLGFMGVQTPLNQSTLQFPWYSLNFNLNLGSPGALAAKVGFIATLTAAWSPTASSGAYQVFTGLKLPGSSGSKREISIEGLFNITFKTLQIIAKPESDTFILVLYNIGFKFLSFTFPPTGQVNFVLFGDPQQAAGSNASLGWYAAYAKPDAKQPPTQKTPRLAGDSLSQE